ncbi:MAG TPA: hypothetical protein PLA12_01185 [Candidatus Hydrogenedens sp.]|nr:hypothetical protein [Candidatus Hydrogenedens sp.]
MDNRRQIIIAGALLVILIGVLFYQFVLAKPKPPSSPSTTNTQAPAPTPAKSPTPTPSTPVSAGGTSIAPTIDTLEQNVDEIIENLLTAIQIVQFNYQEIVPPRNPMTPLVGVIQTTMFEAETPVPSTEVTPGQVLSKKISAIIWDEYQPLAIIDNKLVAEGHTFPDRIQVFKIEPSRIVFKLEDTIFPVRLKEQ